MTADEFGEICLQQDAATVNIQWGDDRVYKVGGKMFGCSGTHTDSLYSFKVDNERFLELTDLDGIRPAPYLARAKWIQIDPAICEMPDAELRTLIRRSYELVFSKLSKKAQTALRGS